MMWIYNRRRRGHKSSIRYSILPLESCSLKRYASFWLTLFRHLSIDEIVLKLFFYVISISYIFHRCVQHIGKTKWSSSSSLSNDNHIFNVTTIHTHTPEKMNSPLPLSFHSSHIFRFVKRYEKSDSGVENGVNFYFRSFILNFLSESKIIASACGTQTHKLPHKAPTLIVIKEEGTQSTPWFHMPYTSSLLLPIPNIT